MRKPSIRMLFLPDLNSFTFLNVDLSNLSQMLDTDNIIMPFDLVTLFISLAAISRSHILRVVNMHKTVSKLSDFTGNPSADDTINNDKGSFFLASFSMEKEISVPIPFLIIFRCSPVPQPMSRTLPEAYFFIISNSFF